jgi:hypothetical protein
MVQNMESEKLIWGIQGAFHGSSYCYLGLLANFCEGIAFELDLML